MTDPYLQRFRGASTLHQRCLVSARITFLSGTFAFFAGLALDGLGLSELSSALWIPALLGLVLALLFYVIAWLVVLHDQCGAWVFCAVPVLAFCVWFVTAQTYQLRTALMIFKLTLVGLAVAAGLFLIALHAVLHREFKPRT